MTQLSLITNHLPFGDIEWLKFLPMSEMTEDLPVFSHDVLYAPLSDGIQEFKGKDFNGSALIDSQSTETNVVTVRSFIASIICENSNQQIETWFNQFKGRNLAVEIKLYDQDSFTVFYMQMSLNISTPEGLANGRKVTMTFRQFQPVNIDLIFQQSVAVITNVVVVCDTVTKKAKLTVQFTGTSTDYTFYLCVANNLNAKIKEFAGIVSMPTYTFTDVANGNYYVLAKHNTSGDIDSYQVAVNCKFCTITRLQVIRIDNVVKEDTLIDFSNETFDSVKP